MTSEDQTTHQDSAAWDLSEWEALREEDTPPSNAAEEPAAPPAPASAELPDPQAAAYLAQHGADTVEHAFALANILHTNRSVAEAATYYGRAFELHSKSPTQYPLAQSLLQVRLLCLLKAGQPVPQHELAELRSLNIPFANYIDGTSHAWRGTPPRDALNIMGNAYDEFHTGEEVDSVALEVALRASPSVFSATPQGDDIYNRIPRKMFLYWDKNPPAEIQKNFDYHKAISSFEVKTFDKEEAAEWLYDNYGIEARTLFLSARHPAEAADFLRVHVIQLLGGWWLDADIRVKSDAALQFMAERKEGSAFFLTHNHVVHNDFFGSVANSDVLTDCLLSLYRNCYLHQGLFIAYKTGPGIFNRALNRIAHRSLKGRTPAKSIEIFDHHVFNDMIEEFDTPYKTRLPSWYTA
ncbi:hypothetical protein JK222_07650 [Gluconobacter cerinus]|uniref:hypothetical protein n=1 Tax=Gluconobacter cerinus TaxID=38307 RepID=UPI001B8B7139|nr:hypothetical protein [Gluconobacter cerinus]MBS1071579.1 hypothetical protein [Gluconobacter cerinus]